MDDNYNSYKWLDDPYIKYVVICKPCNNIFYSKKQYDDHVGTDTHKKKCPKLGKAAEFHQDPFICVGICTQCNFKPLIGAEIERHFIGEMHSGKKSKL